MKGGYPTRRANMKLLMLGLRWCSRCGPPQENEVMLRLVSEGKLAKHPAIKSLSCFTVKLRNPDGSVRAYSAHCNECRARQAKADRRDPVRGERMRAAARRYQKRLMGNPITHARYLEGVRIAYHLRQERKTGRRVTEQRTLSDHAMKMPDSLPYLPARPLAQFIVRRARENETTLGAQCEALGIAERTLKRWLDDGKMCVRYDTADTIMTNANVLPWDIWSIKEIDTHQAHMADGGHHTGA